MLMKWQAVDKQDDEKVLHIQDDKGDWIPYYNHPLMVVDYPLPNGSKGLATYHQLRTQGFVLVSSWVR